jgi:pyruvate kinase
MKFSRAQIVATLGPASRDKKIIEKMIKHQMDAARLNFSWGLHQEHNHLISAVRDAAKKLNKRIPIIQDLSGPRVQEKTGHHFKRGVKDIITDKDIRDLKFGLSRFVDYAAMSYVGKADDVLKLKKIISRFGGKAKTIAKIERKAALNNLDKIIAASDALMIARGDLGNELPLEKIPFVEKTIIEKCKSAGKPAIVATQMLISMTENPLPTRAEVTDVYFAIMNGADAVMLSEESASGKYPAEAVAMMEKISLEAEKNYKIKINPL